MQIAYVLLQQRHRSFVVCLLLCEVRHAKLPEMAKVRLQQLDKLRCRRVILLAVIGKLASHFFELAPLLAHAQALRDSICVRAEVALQLFVRPILKVERRVQCLVERRQLRANLLNTQNLRRYASLDRLEGCARVPHLRLNCRARALTELDAGHVAPCSVVLFHSLTNAVRKLVDARHRRGVEAYACIASGNRFPGRLIDRILLRRHLCYQDAFHKCLAVALERVVNLLAKAGACLLRERRRLFIQG
mmetsp:Transcript_1676/g.4046  ORF Transcript_1676/g.4046 Transcript_1676/m.4046 type:complete len:247 (+) Transcript_1676:1697-2437(+)